MSVSNVTFKELTNIQDCFNDLNKLNKTDLASLSPSQLAVHKSFLENTTKWFKNIEESINERASIPDLDPTTVTELADAQNELAIAAEMLAQVSSSYINLQATDCEGILEEVILLDNIDYKQSKISSLQGRVHSLSNSPLCSPPNQDRFKIITTKIISELQLINKARDEQRNFLDECKYLQIAISNCNESKDLKNVSITEKLRSSLSTELHHLFCPKDKQSPENIFDGTYSLWQISQALEFLRTGSCKIIEDADYNFLNIIAKDSSALIFQFLPKNCLLDTRAVCKNWKEFSDSIIKKITEFKLRPVELFTNPSFLPSINLNEMFSAQSLPTAWIIKTHKNCVFSVGLSRKNLETWVKDTNNEWIKTGQISLEDTISHLDVSNSHLVIGTVEGKAHIYSIQGNSLTLKDTVSITKSLENTKSNFPIFFGSTQIVYPKDPKDFHNGLTIYDFESKESRPCTLLGPDVQPTLIKQSGSGLAFLGASGSVVQIFEPQQARTHSQENALLLSQIKVIAFSSSSSYKQVQIQDFEILGNSIIFSLPNGTLIVRSLNSDKRRMHFLELKTCSVKIQVLFNKLLTQDKTITLYDMEKPGIELPYSLKEYKQIVLMDIADFYQTDPNQAKQLFNNLPLVIRNCVFGSLYEILKGKKSLFNPFSPICGEDAFYERNGEKATNVDRSKAISNIAQKLKK